MAPFPVAAIAGEIGMQILEGEVPPELQMAAKVMGYATMGAMLGTVAKIGFHAIKSAVHYIRKYGVIGSVRRAWGALTGRAKSWVDEKDKFPGACCFTAGTLVWTLVGLAPIESIRVGDIVLAHDTASGESRYRVVTRAFEVTSASVLDVRMLGDAGEESFETSSEHPFYVEGQGWTRADQLRPGDAVRTLSGETRIAVVESVRFTGRRAPVYDLTVDGDHTFHVGMGGVVVHNCGLLVTRALPNYRLKYAPKRRGEAPFGEDNISVNLHHPDATKPLEVIEITYTDHMKNGNKLVNHPDPWIGMTQAGRSAYKAAKRKYWEQQWDAGRFDKLPRRP